MSRVKLYVEGGGDSKEQHVRCREGFRKLLEKAGLAGEMPRIVAGGGRGTTFDQFKMAQRAAGVDFGQQPGLRARILPRPGPTHR